MQCGKDLQGVTWRLDSLEAILDPAPFHPDTLPHPEGGRFMVLFSPPSKESKLEVPHTGLVFPGVSGVEPLFDKGPP